MSPLPIIIDTDPGLGEPGSDIDDGFAIALALASPEVRLLGLTIVNGNVDADTGVDVARRLLNRLGRTDVPVLRGADRPLRRDMGPVRALFEAVLPQAAPSLATKLGPTHPQHAADYMVAQAAANPGEIVVLAIGPMTNLALALERDPSFAHNVRELVLMAGSATTYAQNITVVGDFNAYVDPEALDIVLRSGAKIRMVGLDQTSRVLLTHEDAVVLRSGSADGFSSWAADCTDSWIDFLGKAFPNREEHKTGCFLHDPLVLGAILDPDVCRWADAHVEAETGDSELSRGLVVADRGLALVPNRPVNASVAIDTDVQRFKKMFLDRLGSKAKS